MATTPVVQQGPTSTTTAATPAGAQVQDVARLLPDTALERLRRAYNRAPDQVAELSRQTIQGLYPGASGLLDELRGFFINPPFARDREQILIALLAARIIPRRMYLALHYYWGLMVGLSPGEIAYRLMLIGFYAGVDALTSSLETFSQLLTSLQRHVAAADSDDALAPQAIMGQLRAWFP